MYSYFSRFVTTVCTFVVGVTSLSALPMDIDTSFNPTYWFSGGVPNKILPLANGKILVTGPFSSYNGEPRIMALLEPDGTLNAAFSGTWGASTVNSMIQLSNGYVVMWGNFTTYLYKTSPSNISYIFLDRWRIVKINPLDGMPDTSYNVGSGANDVIFKIVDAGGGKIHVAGRFTTFDSVSRNRIARLNADGSVDMTFDPGIGANNTVWDIALAWDGKIYIVGDFTEFAGVPTAWIVRLMSDGTRDTTFTAPMGYTASKILIQPDGKVIISGWGIGGGKFSPMRLNSNGSIDTTFNTFSLAGWKGANGTSVIPLLYPDGRILIAWNFMHYNGSGSRAIARILPNGLMDTSFNSWSIAGLNNDIYDIALQADGKIFAVGPFTGIEWESAKNIVKLQGGGNPPALDTNPPTVTLLWNSSISLSIGTPFTDPGATWSDTVDGTGTLSSASSGTVNTALSGSYVLEYWKTDAAWNKSSVILRTVNVTPSTPVSTGSVTPPATTGSIVPVSPGTTVPSSGNLHPLISQTGIVALWTTPLGQKTYTMNNRVTDMVCPTIVQPYSESEVVASDIASSPFMTDIKAMIMFRALEGDWQPEGYKISWVANNASLYGPTRSVTRGEFVKMLSRSLGCHYSFTGTDSWFPDVDANNWSAEYITFAVKKWWINGYANGTFWPNNSITRAEAAKILARSIVLDTTGASSSFRDVPRMNTFYPYVSALSTAKIMNGTSATTFKPDANISRWEVARIFYKTFLGGTR